MSVSPGNKGETPGIQWGLPVPGMKYNRKRMLVSAEKLGRAFPTLEIARVLALCASVTSASVPSQEWLKER